MYRKEDRQTVSPIEWVDISLCNLSKDRSTCGESRFFILKNKEN
jgi:hypothetical protein